MAKYLQAQDRSGRGANQNISGECTRTARNYQDAILCARYTGWSHAKRLQLSKSTFKYYLQHQEIEWTCYIKHQQSTKQICRDKRKARFQRFCHSFGARNQDRSLVPKHPIPRERL